ncbi:tRNA lysidine(34) synthetase TilS [Salinarimonas sp.]|uniref:tRNA lysidine(34) synthetase TilS n=1 Tax=Salinarimonas sp. TaxID=2766526 RepID=UPI0032D904A0
MGEREDAPLSDAEANARLAPLLAERAETGLLLAVSGGPDSVALMRLAAPLARDAGARLSVATVDHGLREGSAAEAETVARWARDAGLPHRTLAWTGEKPHAGLQDAARAARYALLAVHAREIGAGALATAHHRDDQAETVLMRLAAGSGIAGLAGMRARADLDGLVLARPFLDLPKARLVATCRARGWPHVEDPSNAAARFARARLRGIAPLLAAEGLDAARLARLAGRAARADDALEAATEAAFARIRIGEAPLLLDAGLLRAEPEEIALRVLARALREAGGGVGYDRLLRLEALWARLAPALDANAPFRATLAGALVDAAGGRIRVAPEPPRRHR